MELTPLTVKEAMWFVSLHHRRHRAPQGGLFVVGAAYNGTVIGQRSKVPRHSPILLDQSSPTPRAQP